MPNRSMPMCHIPGCPNKADHSSLCLNHQKQRNKDIDNHRDPKTRELYDYRWQRNRKMFLNANPLCAECFKDGEIRKAEVVDHIISHHGDQDLFNDMDNWQSLCKHHHDSKTMKEMNQNRRA